MALSDIRARELNEEGTIFIAAFGWDVMIRKCGRDFYETIISIIGDPDEDGFEIVKMTEFVATSISEIKEAVREEVNEAGISALEVRRKAREYNGGAWMLDELIAMN